MPALKTFPFFWLALSLLIQACGATPSLHNDDVLYSDASAPGVLLPANADEGDILKQMEKLGPGQSVTMGNRIVSVESGYHAASGRDCRIVAIASGSANSSRRLVCRINETWNYAPDVYPALPVPAPQ